MDYQLFESNPRGHYLTSVIIHCANSILLFLILERLNRDILRSTLVAALFCIHPLNVESVAWIAQRKNVLGTFWSFVVILAYTDFVKRQKLFFWVILFLSLSLKTKPISVTIPFLLLLLDFWPLQRFSFNLNNTKKIK
jgi:hypothetical protein|tara:strand:- start:116 stop:529 length:414 start_codon:yes stop_codon:yes gene_type:complete